MEAEAVIAILNGCTTAWELVGSEVIEYEISNIPDEEKMRSVESLLQVARERVLIDERIMNRARTLNQMGIDAFDALHLASAEIAGAILLTTDDSLIRVIKKHADKIPIEVYNPVQWLMEVTADGSEDT